MTTVGLCASCRTEPVDKNQALCGFCLETTTSKVMDYLEGRAKMPPSKRRRMRMKERE